MYSEYPRRKSRRLSQTIDFFKSYKYSIANCVLSITGIAQPVIGISVKLVLIKSIQLCERFIVTLSGWMYKLFFVHFFTTYILSIKKEPKCCKKFQIFQKNFINVNFVKWNCEIINNFYENNKKFIQNHCDFFVVFIINAEFTKNILHFVINNIIILTTHC